MKKAIYMFSLVIALCGATFAYSQTTPTWQDITPKGWSGNFKFLEYFEGNGLLAIADNGYFYHSTDTAKTWTIEPSPVGEVWGIEVYPDRKRALIYSGKKLYMTTDAAKTWQEIALKGMPSDMYIHNIYIKNEDTVFACTGNNLNGRNIFLSPDKGETWTQVAERLYGTSSFYYVTDFYFATPAHGYALGVSYYMETFDGGTTWTKTTMDLDTYFHSVLEIEGHPTIVALNGYSGVPFLDSAIHITNEFSKMIYVNGKVYGISESSGSCGYSVDYGKTWNYITIDDSRIFYGISFLDENNGVIVGRDLTTYRTNDGGATWTKSVYGGAEGFNKIYAKSADECYVLGRQGRLFHTIDGGDNWDFNDLYNDKLCDIEFQTSDTGYVTAEEVLFRTIDGGKTWEQLFQPSEEGKIDFPTKDIGYAFASGVVYKTTNAGNKWSISVDMTFIENKGSGGGICFLSAEEGFVAGTKCILYTNNGGTSWSVMPESYGAADMLKYTESEILVFGKPTYDTVVVYTCDRNSTCTKLTSLYTGGYLFFGAYNGPMNSYYICAGSNYNSSDGGLSWNKEDLLGECVSMSFPTSHVGYSVGSGIVKITYPYELNASFEKINENTYSCLITCNENISYQATVALYNENTVYYEYPIDITTGETIIISIPEYVASGTYYLSICPQDTSLYVSVQSEPFEIKQSTAIEEVTETPCFYIKDKSVVSTIEEDVQVFDMLGQRMLVGKPLHDGVYMVVTKQGAQKVVVK